MACHHFPYIRKTRFDWNVIQKLCSHHYYWCVDFLRPEKYHWPPARTTHQLLLWYIYATYKTVNGIWHRLWKAMTPAITCIYYMYLSQKICMACGGNLSSNKPLLFTTQNTTFCMGMVDRILQKSAKKNIQLGPIWTQTTPYHTNTHTQGDRDKNSEYSATLENNRPTQIHNSTRSHILYRYMNHYEWHVNPKFPSHSTCAVSRHRRLPALLVYLSSKHTHTYIAYISIYGLLCM